MDADLEGADLSSLTGPSAPDRRGFGTREWRPGFALDVHLTLTTHRRGSGDPAFRITRDGAVWRTSQTPQGPGTLCVTPGGELVRARAWGPGAEWLLDGLPALLGSDDDPAAL